MDVNEASSSAKTVDSPPSVEFAATVAGMVEVHVRAGHFAIARRVLDQAERDWAEELREQTRQLCRSPEQWLDRPLAEFGLLVRTVNALERVGCDTMREALAYLNTGTPIPNFGETSCEEVWQAARERRIGVERKYHYKVGGGAGQGHKPTAETAAKFNPKFETGGSRENT